MDDELNMVLYFWEEKGDPERYTGYEQWAKANPNEAFQLKSLINDANHAEKRVGQYLRSLGAET